MLVNCATQATTALNNKIPTVLIKLNCATAIAFDPENNRPAIALNIGAINDVPSPPKKKARYENKNADQLPAGNKYLESEMKRINEIPPINPEVLINNCSLAFEIAHPYENLPTIIPVSMLM